MNKEIIACFPQWASYSYAFKYLCEHGFEVKYLMAPPITKKTLELGSKNSPDFVCSPFKFCLGCHIEALEMGANCLMMIYGSCRLNYYGELSEKILRDMGYEFNYFNMASVNWKSPKSIVENLKIINPNVKLRKVVEALPCTLKIVETIDELDDFLRHNVGFEVNEGEFDKAYNDFLGELSGVEKKKDVKKIRRKYLKIMKAIEVKKPEKIIRVGMIGDYYTVQEPFSNYFMEKELAKMGMEIERKMDLTNSIIHSQFKKRCKTAKKYAKFSIGATGNFTIGEALMFAREKVDGIIQVKSFGCTPEIDAMPILQNISKDYKIPVLHFSFDSQTSETGVKTRLEAFYDMVVARKGM